jgi:inward rectifier potassium channel
MVQPRFEPSPLAPRRTAEEEARDRDLGFGTVVSRESRARLLNRDGSFNVRRDGMSFLEKVAPYQLLRISWPRYLGLVAVLYLLFNLLFATGYLACGRDALLGVSAGTPGGRFTQAFFFSIQTFATIGYGQIVPNGLPANLLVTIEALVGLMFQALATGLLFARFVRPKASILFSHRAVVAPYGSGRALQFRIANRQRNEIIELEAQVIFSAMESDERGSLVRRYRPLPLERNKVTFFPLSWTIVHPIDDNSPLSGKGQADLEAAQAEILILLSGIDETFEQTVHARSSYRVQEIVWNARFRSMFLPIDRRAGVSVDVSTLHDIEELA